MSPFEEAIVDTMIIMAAVILTIRLTNMFLGFLESHWLDDE